jgi:phosphate transport system protein
MQELRDRISQVGACVVGMIANSVRALVARDSELAHRTMARASRVLGFEAEAHELALEILAHPRPVTSDLRFITTGLKVVSDLALAGNQCVHICERALELDREPPLASCDEISRMGGIAQEMIRDVLRAFLDSDPERARQVIERDRAVDGYDEQLLRELLARQPANDTGRTIGVYAAARSLECIGDGAVHIAEMTVRMAQATPFGLYRRDHVSQAARA